MCCDILGDLGMHVFAEELATTPPAEVIKPSRGVVARVALLLAMLFIAVLDWPRHADFSCRRWCFLTNWAFDLIFLCHVCMIAARHRWGRIEAWTWPARALHILQQVSTTTALCVTFIYWTAIRWALRKEPETVVEWVADVGVHLFNSVVVLADVAISRRRFFRRHWVFGTAFLAAYFSFNGVYSLVSGEQFYELVSFGSFTEKVQAVCFGVTTMTMQAIVHFVMWLFTRIRRRPSLSVQTQQIVVG